MRVHVISDMEGVAGIVKWQQTTGGEKLYDEGRVLYIEEINAAVRGATAAGASEIVVMDCHGAGGAYDFNSLVPDLLDPACEYVVQQEWTEYTSFLEAGCDAALFIGMHAMAGTADGVLSHTASSPVTSRTGQPHVPQSAALIPVSPTSVPLKRRLCHAWPETVWDRTPSAVPAIACMPTKSAASQPASRKPVYSVHSCCTTYSQAGSRRSGTSELKSYAPPAPWQSMTTISVAPAAFAPRTAALISSV